MSDLWVARLHVSEAVAEKISSKHGLAAPDVRDQLQRVERLFYVWDDDPVRGLRAIVQIDVRGRQVLAVLYPADGLPDEYRLGSAYPRRG